MSLTRTWCYTLNNYTDAELSTLRGLTVRCHIAGFEVGENGTPHLQGYIAMRKPQRLSFWKNNLPRAHVEMRRGSEMDAWNYCKKDGNIAIEVGKPSGAINYSNRNEEGLAVIDEIESGASYFDIRERHKLFFFWNRRSVIGYMVDQKRSEFNYDPVKEEFQKYIMNNP